MSSELPEDVQSAIKRAALGAVIECRTIVLLAAAQEEAIKQQRDDLVIVLIPRLDEGD